jgi:photosystem II stability/assembly factor-like uncharacterized protein
MPLGIAFDRSAMSRRILIAIFWLLLVARVAEANGRTPGISTINFRRGMESEIVVGATFGLVKSVDGGATWRWMCEAAVGYGGTYDPDYAFTSAGTVFATTFTGLKVNRDGCRFDAVSSSTKFVSTATAGPDGAIYFAVGDAIEARLYKSTDDGQSFSMLPPAGTVQVWWQSMEVAPSDPDRIYLFGYRAVGGFPTVFMLRRSDDGGQTWMPLSTAGITTMPSSIIEVAGISKTNPDLVFAKVQLEDNTMSDAIYRSTDGGQSWMRILGKPESIAFVVRASGELVAATRASGAVRSRNMGATWDPLPGAPHINCLTESAAGEVWACTQNYSRPGEPGDDAGIMKTTDLVTWTKVLRFQELREPVSCGAGTPQRDECDLNLWCGVCVQIGCEPLRSCPGAGMVDAPSEGGGGGCCGTGGGAAPGAFMLAAWVGYLLRHRRPAARGRAPT